MVQLEGMVTLDQVRRLQSSTELAITLARVEAQERELEARLYQLSRKRNELDAVTHRLIRRLCAEVLTSAVRPYAEELAHDAKGMTALLDTATEKARMHTAPVRRLDAEEAKIRSAMQKIDDAKEMRDCIVGVLESLSLKDYDRAAVHLFRSTKMADSVLESSAASLAMTVQPSGHEGQSVRDILERARADLSAIAQREFAEAVRTQDQTGIRRFFKLLPMIGESSLGLVLYSDFLCSLVSDRCRAQLAQVGNKHFGVRLTELYEMVAMAIDHHHPLVETNYGPGHMLYVIYRLQREVDTQAGIIMGQFSEEHRLSLIDQSGRSSTSSSGRHGGESSQTTAGDSAVDLRQLDTLLKELAVISQKTALYRRFLQRRAKAEIDAVDANGIANDADIREAALALDEAGLLREGRIASAMESLLRGYAQMERYFARKSISKVLHMDEVDDNDKTSTSLEDVFFILKNCTQRALSIGSDTVGSAMVKLLARILEVDYLRILHQRLSTSTSSLDAKDVRRGHMVCLNNMDVACDYMPKLVEELKQRLGSQTNNFSETEVSALSASFRSFTELEAKTRDILKENLEDHFDEHIRAKLRAIAQKAFRPARYLLTEAGYEEQEMGDSVGSRFIVEAEGLLAPFELTADARQTTLTESNWRRIHELAACAILSEWETVLMAARVNQLGALRVDKDVRLLSSFLSAKTAVITGVVRERLTRLGEISMLLNMDELADLDEIWQQMDGGHRRCLDAGEVRRILLLR
ncbi:COG4 transport protein-domain-containing protein [Thamnocephalis sphaerospora]|uniref:Conserved oligomeric Golgi complex subunit 4 n=1 Tax=Thamnocephalis sphaerospora TaxID=78915 RepID=A0A4P9XRI8_9FUNG|nr:COG4 transport protein-domain-containing protein [Thamnocephalis sphaerospora]|eukprot:RKP08562.1 COG4 transport protein-domain-containing protein [Thamnocephalis sphaerospora]